ncbi:hypothetical protein FGG78_29135 [Thioclava sp. BHET1]|nr:hypothetical protein FGG78_29135 [Thioclava sp. BHET1]
MTPVSPRIRAGLCTLAIALPFAIAAALPTQAATNRVFLGVGLSFGSTSGYSPEALVGLSHSQESERGKVTGFKATVGLDMNRGFTPAKAQLSGLWGHSNTQLEAGLGYNFENASAYGLAGANGPHYQLGGTYDFRSGFGGYGDVTTLTKLKKH